MLLPSGVALPNSFPTPYLSVYKRRNSLSSIVLTWLYSKVRTGYTIVDIGIDINRTARSSSYIAEKNFFNHM